MKSPSKVRFALLASILVATGCEVGPQGGGGDDGDDMPDASVDAPAPSYAMTVTPTVVTQLGTVATLMVDITASNFSGPVTLSASGAPASWQVAITPATVDAVADQPVTAEVRITIPSNGDAAPTGQMVTINGASSAGARTAAASVTVENVLVVGLGTPGTAGRHFGTMAGGQIRMKQGAKLRLPNTDTVPHRIHSGGDIPGVPHQAASMPGGGMYEVTLNATGSDIFYCHDHGHGTGEVRLTVE